MEYFTIFCQYQYSDYLDYIYTLQGQTLGVLTERSLYQEIFKVYFL